MDGHEKAEPEMLQDSQALFSINICVGRRTFNHPVHPSVVDVQEALKLWPSVFPKNVPSNRKQTTLNYLPPIYSNSRVQNTRADRTRACLCSRYGSWCARRRHNGVRIHNRRTIQCRHSIDIDRVKPDYPSHAICLYGYDEVGVGLQALLVVAVKR